MTNYLDDLPKQFLVLAPMEDVTDTVFRRVIARNAPFDLYFTEFANVDGLQSPGRKVVGRRLRFEPEEQPLVAQIWGRDPQNFYKTAQELVEMGFVGIDINMGCPVKAVVKEGCGGGIIAFPERAKEIIQAVKDGSGGAIPVSVKTRIGLKDYQPEWIKMLLEQDLAMLTVHLRTVKEMSLADAHWELMDDIKKLRDEIAPHTKLVANGDIKNRQHAEELMKKHGLDGAMIGRGVFHDPFAALSNSHWADLPPAQKLDLYRQHIELFQATWAGESRPIAPLNKFCKTYVNGFAGAKEMREQLMHCKTIEELRSKVVERQQALQLVTA